MRKTILGESDECSFLLGHMGPPQRTKSHPIISAANPISAVPPQPSQRVRRPEVNTPITFSRVTSTIMAAMIGTATTPLITALQ